MSPVFPLNDSVDYRSADREHSRRVELHYSVVAHLPNRPDSALVEFCLIVAAPASWIVSAFAPPVIHVLLMGPGEQVGRVAALPVIARVERLKWLWQWADKQFVRGTIDTNRRTARKANHSVPIWVYRSSPFDTTAIHLLCFSNQSVEKCSYRLLTARENATLIRHDSLHVSGL
jgi:hypothetical protein